MHLHCIGLNHQTAPISVRERLAFSDAEIKAALSPYGCGGSVVPSGISEVVILSTCNRVEIYAVAPSYAMQELEAFLLNERKLLDDNLKNSLYRLVDEAVIDHLFRVAAGLDSLVIGEPQILGQVMHALDLGRRQNTTGRVLLRLFEVALRAGKCVRTVTSIGQKPTSVASVAIHLASQTISDFPSAKILVIGGGEMAEMALAALKKRGVDHLRVVNRTFSRAEQLANRFGCQAHTFGRLSECLSWADVVITSTGAPHTILQRELMNEIMKNRSPRPLVLIDIAVPRDIDADVAEIPGVKLYDLDMLEEYLGVSLELRAQQIPKAESILNDFSNEFKEYLQMLDVIPLIAALHQRAEMIRQVELEKTIGRLPDLNDTQREHLHLLPKALVKKILNAPTRQLRTVAGSPLAVEYTSVARELFELDENQLIV
jgi:glutamyl-tRNA reductase